MSNITTTKSTLNVSAFEEVLFSKTHTSRSLQSVLFKSMSRMSRAQSNRLQNGLVDITNAELSIRGVDNTPSQGFNHSLNEDEIKTTLPAVKTQDVRTVGQTPIHWTDLSMLPGASSESIMVLAMSVFKHFGLKDNSPIRVIAATANGDLLNSNLEVNSVLGFLEKHTVKLSPDNLTISFDGVITNYAPDIRLYYSKKHTYLAVFEDDEGIDGRYIYAFERQDNSSLIEE